jgi:hypothetical protein
MTKENTTYAEVEALTRWASKASAFAIESSDPVDTATNVPINKTINLIMSLAMDPTTISSSNVTLTPSVARTVSLHTDGRTIIVDPNTNLAASITLKENIFQYFSQKCTVHYRPLTALPPPIILATISTEMG